MAPKAKPATKFDAAMAATKAGAPKAAATKAAASSKAGYPASSASAKVAAKPAAPAKPLTLEEAKKLVEKTEFKIEDLEQELADCNAAKEKKELQAKIKKLQEEPRYVEAKQKIADSVEEKRKAEMLGKQALSTANVVKADNAEDEEELLKITEDVSVGAAHGHFTSIAKGKTDDEKLKAARKFGAQIRGLGIAVLHKEDFAERIEKMLKGKDKEEKLVAWAAVAGLGWATPYVETLFKQAIDGVDAMSLAAAKSMMQNASPNGIGHRLIPQLIDAIQDKKWKTQMRSIQITPAAWSKLSKSATVSKHAPKLLPVLNASMQAIRADVKDAGKSAVNEIFKNLYNPEIRSLSEYIIPAMEDPSKQELTWKALGKISNTTFMNYIDAGSLAFLAPIILRAMKERNAESKMKGTRILGSLIILVFNRPTLMPYVPSFMPLLKECITDTSAEVQTESSVTVGNFARYLTDLYDESVEPWLFEFLRSAELNERQGAAKALAQAMLALGEPRLGELIDRATATAADVNAKNTMRSGALELLESCADILKDEFSKHVPKVLTALLPGTSQQDEIISGPAYRAARSLVDWFSDTKPRALLSGLVTGLVNQDEMCRVNTVTLSKRVVERVLGRKKDFLKVVSSISNEQRQDFLAAMYINRYDESNEVRRNVSKFLQESVVSLPETFRAIKKNLIERLNEYSTGSATMRMLAEKSLAELSTAEDWDPTAVVSPNGNTNGDAASSKTSSSETLEAYDTTSKAEIDTEKLSEQELQNLELAKKGVKDSLGESPASLGVSQEVLDFATSVAMDVAMSCGTSAEKYEVALQNAMLGFLDKAERDKLVQGLCQAMCAKRERLGTDQGETTLCCVENLFLCYGGGKLLLRDTTLELIKDHRYGVVGRNGCGKTTLMNQMSAGGLAGMPPELKCVHVKHEVLPTIQELTPVEFCRRECPHIDDAGIDRWLDDVGFPLNLKNTKVAELSGGFCMRLILACGLMQDPDVLLLDEPTNHLDEDSINWLADYLNSMTRSSLMVVSHEPAFLDKICTDIIQYREMKMMYYKGNFTSFRAQAGISDADCADILDGGPAAEKTGTAEGAGGDSDEDGQLVGYGTGARSKIMFPIPTKLTGVTASKPVLETKTLGFGFTESGPLIFDDVSVKLTQTGRVALTGRNGSGKSTLLAVIAGELHATKGDVVRHRNLRVAYIPQNQLFYLSDFNELSPQTYIQARFKNGYDELVQTRLLQCKDEEERQKKAELAKKYGKQGCGVRTIVGRTVKGKDVLYEVAWEGLTDEKQNTQEPLSKLKQMGAEGEARAFDERNAVLSNAQEVRQVTRREIIKHFELFGLDEDMVCNRQIGGFSAGQKSKLMLASSMWTRPQVILLDEPTNYVDVETLDAIARALRNFRGGIVISSRDQGFLDKVCTETWLVEDGQVTVSKRETYNAGD